MSDLARERMLIAVGLDHETHVLVCKGRSIEHEIEVIGVGSDLGLDAIIEEPGLWVVTCAPKWVEDSQGDGYTDYNHEVTIQAPSEGEWAHIRAREFGLIKVGWADITPAEPRAEPPFIDPEDEEDHT